MPDPMPVDEGGVIRFIDRPRNGPSDGAGSSGGVLGVGFLGPPIKAGGGGASNPGGGGPTTSGSGGVLNDGGAGLSTKATDFFSSATSGISNFVSANAFLIVLVGLAYFLFFTHPGKALVKQVVHHGAKAAH